jgi:hypothetical protein
MHWSLPLEMLVLFHFMSIENWQVPTNVGSTVFIMATDVDTHRPPIHRIRIVTGASSGGVPAGSGRWEHHARARQTIRRHSLPL